MATLYLTPHGRATDFEYRFGNGDFVLINDGKHGGKTGTVVGGAGGVKHHTKPSLKVTLTGGVTVSIPQKNLSFPDGSIPGLRYIVRPVVPQPTVVPVPVLIAPVPVCVSVLVNAPSVPAAVDLVRAFPAEGAAGLDATAQPSAERVPSVEHLEPPNELALIVEPAIDVASESTAIIILDDDYDGEVTSAAVEVIDPCEELITKLMKLSVDDRRRVMLHFMQ